MDLTGNFWFDFGEKLFVVMFRRVLVRYKISVSAKVNHK